MSDLTQKQADVLDFVARAERPPTYREICERFGWQSPNAAQGHVRALIAKGRLERVDRKSRCLRAVRDPIDVDIAAKVYASKYETRHEKHIARVAFRAGCNFKG